MDKVVYNMPFAKVDQQRRIVSGFATLNNLDKQKDIVLAEASMKAFKSFRGNIREQHSRIAAGKVLSFGIEQFFDKVANKVYDGIFVRAYISKGAPDTWEKVLDGTLNGFSIGGEILDFENQIDEDGNAIRVIKDYELGELSLVDNPANGFANITSIEKSHNYFADMAENVQEKELEKMEDSTTNDDGVIVSPVADPPAQPEPEPEPDVVEDSGIVVAPESDNPPPDKAPDTVPVPAQEPTPVEDTDTSDSEVLTNAINEIKALLEDRDSKTNVAFAALVEQLKELRTGIDNANASTTNVAGELASVKSAVSEFDSRINSVEKDTAVRKSVDLGEVEQESKNTVTEKSIWGGRFLTADH